MQDDKGGCDMVDLKGRPFYLDEGQIAWVKRTLEGMTAEEKAGQLFLVMGQDYAPERLLELTARGRIGGVLFRPEPLQAILDRYRPLDEAARVPLLKAANLEEGGAGAISDGTLFGWPMMCAAAGDEQTVERFAKVCALEGRRAGINWTFSPVCDIDMNFRNPITNVRTYGSDPLRVKRNSALYADTVQRCGMAACAKHFPGDGVDYRDQHLHPTYNTLDADTWRRTYGAVYQNLIDHDLLSVMAGHIVQPDVSMRVNPSLRFEDCLPASMSPELLGGVLRGELGFNGVITTDATIMGGFCMAMERRRAIPASIAAGCDMIVFNTNFEEDFAFLMAGIEEGIVSARRLDEAVTRILALKARVCFAPPCMETLKEEWPRECAERAVTLVKDRQPEVWPVSARRYPRIRLITLGKDGIADGSVGAIAENYLRAAGFEVERYRPEEDELHGPSRLPKDTLTLYLANYEQASNQTSVRIDWCKKHAMDMPRFVNEERSIFVSLGNPYLLQDVPRAKTYINAYTATRTTIEAVLKKLIEGGPFTGESPVDAFCGLADTRL